MTTTLPSIEETTQESPVCRWLGTSSFCSETPLRTLSRVFTTADGREVTSPPVPACESCTREAVADLLTLETLDGLVLRRIGDAS